MESKEFNSVRYFRNFCRHFLIDYELLRNKVLKEIAQLFQKFLIDKYLCIKNDFK